MTEHVYTPTAVKNCMCKRCVAFRTPGTAVDMTGVEGWPHQPSPYSDPPTDTRFDALLAQMKQVHDKKGQDYEAHNIPYENIKASEQWSVEPWTYAMLRVSEKIRRLHSVANGKTLQNEDIYDTFIDIANLALIAHILYEEAKK